MSSAGPHAEVRGVPPRLLGSDKLKWTSEFAKLLLRYIQCCCRAHNRAGIALGGC
jgi:hypothetical protein